MYTCDGKVEFSTSITPVFSVTCSFRNHSNWLICTLSMLKTFVLLKEEHLLEIENFYNIINVFTVTFDQMNVSLLN